MHFPDDFEFVRLKPRSKIPLEDGWTTSPPLSRQQARTIIRQGGNYGVRLRAQDLVIDIDPRNGGTETALGFDTSIYPTVLTPSGGKHIYMRLPEGVKIRHTIPAFGEGIEFETLGRQVVGPGSIHPNGGVYEWDVLAGTDFTQLIPEALLARIRKTETTILGTGEWTPEQLGKALAYLNPYDFGNHDSWFALMCAAHEATGGAGEDVFTEWSIGDEKYAKHAPIIRQRWQSLNTGKTGNAGPGTLLHILVEHGITDLNFEVTEFRAIANESVPVSTTKTPLQDMNERFYVVQEDGKLRILEIRESDETKVRSWIRHSKKDFLEVAESVYHYPLMEIQKGEKTVTVPLAKLWIERKIKGKRFYPGGVVFAPEVNEERVGDSLNLWRGFAFSAEPFGTWALLEEMLSTILCRGDEQSFDYVLNWMARAVQYPHIPAGTACVFKGIKGTGKGTLGRTFSRLFGVHGKHIGSMGAITGRFNAHLRDCVALFADEAYWAGDRSGESMLKALITEPTLLYEAKGLTPQMGRNCIHILMASNLDWVIPAGLDAERRFAVFETTDEIRPYAFWAELNRQLDNGGYETLLYDLLHRDISKFHVHAVPNTEALTQQKIESMDLAEQWIFSLLDSGNWNGLPVVEELNNGYITLLSNDLITDFERSLRNRKTFRSAETQTGMALKKYIPAIQKCRIQRPESRIDVLSLRPWAFHLPPLERAKSKFIEILGRNVFDN